MSDIPRGQTPLEDEAPLGPEDDVEGAEDLEKPPAEGDGEDGDDAGGEDEGGEEEEVLVDEPPAPRRGGGSRTVREQRRRAQEAERRTAALEREVQELRIARAQPAYDPAAAQRQEQEFFASLEMMPQAQAYQALMQRGEQRVGQVLQNMQFQAHDLADQTRFEASCARSPTREGYRDRVEDYRKAQLQRGFVISREEAYHLLLGRDVEARANKARPKQQREAAARVNGQQTRPTGARSNTQPGARRPQPGSLDADRALINAAIARGERVL